jgi:ubiquinone/menaquinone biosynthesis C-methylase UbiE
MRSLAQHEPAPAEVASLYDTFGPVLSLIWDDNFHCGFWSGPDDDSSVQQATDRLTDLLIQRIGVGPGDEVLDVGCGIGKPAFRLALATGAAVVGISINRGEVEQATERAHAEGLDGQVRFTYADGMAIPFPDASFDAVWALESIMHMNRPRAVAEMARVVKPGGRIVLTDLFEKGLSENVTDGAGDLSSFIDHRSLVEDAGLELDELTDLSEQIMISRTKLAEALRTKKDVIEARFGSDALTVVEAILNPPGPASEFGMVILVAHRPEAAERLLS